MNTRDEIRAQVSAGFRWGDAMLYYYGFESNSPLPTLERTGSQFGGITRERVRQIRDNFIAFIAHPRIRSLTELGRLIATKPIWSDWDLQTALTNSQLDCGGLEIRSLLRLLNDGQYQCNYTLHDGDMEKSRGHNDVLPEHWLLVCNDIAGTVREKLLLSKKLPANSGLAPISGVLHGIADPSIENALRLIWSMDPDFVSVKDGQDELFLFENRRNALITQLRKVAAVVKRANFNELCASLQRSLVESQFGPNATQIGTYLRKSKNVRIEGEEVRFEIVGEPLRGCELAVFKNLTSLGVASSPVLIGNVRKDSSYTDIAINKALRNSAFIFVDESNGRRHHSFRVLGDVILEPDLPSVRYLEFSRRLVELTEDGSDVECEGFRRQEQTALREYLFADRGSECCAICGVEYLPKSLVAAHKKKRSDCKEYERTDPYIVMPLCKFGCDHLYEERHARIVGGVVTCLIDTNTLQVGERDHIKEIVGRKIDEKWLRGSSHYFD